MTHADKDQCTCGSSSIMHAEWCAGVVLGKVDALLRQCPEGRGEGSLVERLAVLVVAAQRSRDTISIISSERDEELGARVRLEQTLAGERAGREQERQMWVSEMLRAGLISREQAQQELAAKRGTTREQSNDG